MLIRSGGRWGFRNKKVAGCYIILSAVRLGPNYEQNVLLVVSSGERKTKSQIELMSNGKADGWGDGWKALDPPESFVHLWVAALYRNGHR